MVWNPAAPCDLPPPPDRRRRRRRLFPDYSVLEPAQNVRITKALGREDVRYDILVSLQRPSRDHDAKLLVPPQTPTIREESPSAVICSPIQRQAPIAVVVGIERLEISPHDVVPRREVAHDAERVVARRLAVFGPGSRVDDFDGRRELVAQPLAVGGAQERMSACARMSLWLGLELPSRSCVQRLCVLCSGRWLCRLSFGRRHMAGSDLVECGDVERC